MASKLRAREKELSKDLAVKQRQDAKLKSAITQLFEEIEAEKERQESVAKQKRPRPTRRVPMPVLLPLQNNFFKVAQSFRCKCNERLASDNFERIRNFLAG